MKRVIIAQGGGFRTAFTAGIIDCLLSKHHKPFDGFIGVSGGAIALSYYLSDQYGACIDAMKYLSQSDDFFQFRRLMSHKGYMDIEKLRMVANEKVPFDLDHGLAEIKDKEVYFVSTDKVTGDPVYLRPEKEDWVDVVIASCTLPFVTKGTHVVRGMKLMDGGWTDPIPVRWAIEQGAEEILILRTTHISKLFSQSWPDYFGSKFYENDPALHKIFSNNHQIYNNTLSFLGNPPNGVKITQIWPEEGLNCGTYGHSLKAVLADYRYGVHAAQDYLSR